MAVMGEYISMLKSLNLFVVRGKRRAWGGERGIGRSTLLVFASSFPLAKCSLLSFLAHGQSLDHTEAGVWAEGRSLHGFFNGRGVQGSDVDGVG